MKSLREILASKDKNIKSILHQKPTQAIYLSMPPQI
jgi:hypothetical protein